MLYCNSATIELGIMKFSLFPLSTSIPCKTWLIAGIVFKLYTYFEVIKEVKKYYKEHPELIEDEMKYIKRDEDRRNDEINTIIYILHGIYETIGNPFKEDLKYNISDDKFKAFTYNGVLTIDFLRLGLPKKERDLFFNDEKELNLGDSTNNNLHNLFIKIYNNF